MPRAKRVPSGGGAVGVLAGEQAAGERVVGDDRDPLFLAQRQQVSLERAEQQVVARLNGGDAGQVLQLAAPERPGELCAGQLDTPT